jgi:two-component system, NtrC family, response regulator
MVEDDEGLRSQYRWAFPHLRVLLAQSRPQALALAETDKPPVVVMDLGLPPDPDGVSEGFALLDALCCLQPDSKIIVVTGNGGRAHALRAIASGAYDFCEKPVEVDVLRTIVHRAAQLHDLEAENRRLLESGSLNPIKRIITSAPSMLKVCATVERLAAANASVILLGESGTGKEALARALHDLGPRARHPFIAINCAAIPETLLESELFGYERGAFTGAHKQTIGKIESAHKGTLFLDEIGDLPQPLQVKLLRFLQDHVIERIGSRQQIEVDVRVVSATNAAIEEQVDDGRFRGDLFYRLNSISVRIPPLRERGGDPALLARYFLARFNHEFDRNLRGFAATAVTALAAHHWPGNVRELENRIKRAVIMADGRLITAADLELGETPDVAESLDLRAARLRAEQDVIQKALARCNGQMTAAAKLLGVSRPTLYTLLEAHGMTASPGKLMEDDAEITFFTRIAGN